jgi:hypothetical protein
MSPAAAIPRITSMISGFMRFTLGINSIPTPFSGDNWYSDLHQASQTWFWHIW